MSLRKAINEKCKDCTYDSLDRGTWLFQVGNCDSKDCPLWEVRPKPTSQKKAEKEVNLIHKTGRVV